jgi:hypothetical protein
VKQSIEWHEECLRNSKRYTKDLRDNADDWRRVADKAQADDVFLEFQIDNARKKGKDGFDSDRFCMKVPANV